MEDSRSKETGSEKLFEPESLCNHFIEITRRAHPSGSKSNEGRGEDPVRIYVAEQANEIENVQIIFYEEKAIEPGKRVIVLSRPGSEPYSNAKPVILQAHLDMVCNPDDMKFPLKLSVKQGKDNEQWLTANENKGKKSTLGADDGIGVAAALAILADKSLAQYPLECLFTVQEETDMGGVKGCDISKLTGDKLVNLDSETLTEIIYGSAGGCGSEFFKNKLEREEAEHDSFVKLVVQNLKGGHSGVDIGKNRLNAIKALFGFLSNNPGKFKLYSFQRLDSMTSNSIPAKAEVVVNISPDDVELFINDFKSYCEKLVDEESKLDNDNFQAEIIKNIKGPTLTGESTDRVVNILNEIPSGAIKRDKNFVITSTNLYNVILKDIEGDLTVQIDSSNRSSNEKSFKELLKQFETIGKKFNFKVTNEIDPYPMWEPDEDSQLLAKATDIYKKKYGDKFNATAIHAGLECAVLFEKFKKAGRPLECIAIGPTITDPHTPNEQLQIKDPAGKESVLQFYECVKEIIEHNFNK